MKIIVPMIWGGISKFRRKQNKTKTTTNRDFAAALLKLHEKKKMK